MRHNKFTKKQCQLGGVNSQIMQANDRLANALNYRPVNSLPIFEIWTYNPSTGAKNHLEIKHEMGDGNNRYSVYLDGKRWHKPWSRTGFCLWLFGKIDAVVFG